MGEFIPDYLIREQAAVGALVVFALVRVLAAVAACSRGWPIAIVEKCAIGLAGLYCAATRRRPIASLCHARVLGRAGRQGHRLDDGAVFLTHSQSQARL